MHKPIFSPSDGQLLDGIQQSHIRSHQYLSRALPSPASHSCWGQPRIRKLPIRQQWLKQKSYKELCELGCNSTSRHKTSSSQKNLNLKTQKQYRVRTHCQLKSHIANPMKIHHMPNTEHTILLQILYTDQEPLLDYVTHQCEFVLMISQGNHSTFNPKIVQHIGNIQQRISQKPHRNCTEDHTRIQGQE
jgi:hypothetical protein